MHGTDVKKLLRNRHICQWQLALELGVSESTLVRRLRGSLSKEHETAILEAIERILQGE